jgi:hypothetical protein
VPNPTLQADSGQLGCFLETASVRQASRLAAELLSLGRLRPGGSLNILSSFTHVAYDPIVLVVASCFSSAVLLAVILAARPTISACAGLGRWVLLAGIVFRSPLPLLLVPRDHIPGLMSLPVIPPPSFCFGQRGLLHVVAFALPIATALVALRLVLSHSNSSRIRVAT